MLKVLIADGAEEFCLALSGVLQDKYQVRVCHDGYQTLELLRSFRPDILVLELMLPGYDGLSVLQTARAEDLQVPTLVTTRLVSDYVSVCLEKLDVRYLMVKPCDMKAMELRIGDLAGSLGLEDPGKEDPKTVIYSTLLALSVPAKLKGFAYLWDGILLLSKDISQPMTKELYPAVAKLHEANGSQVERAIRSAIDAAWSRREPQVWKKYFQNDREKPTNTEFLIRLAHTIITKA